MAYDPIKTEQYWQNYWKEEKTFAANLKDTNKPIYYNLTMFPYPSGDRLHVGHWYNYAPLDSWGRFMRLKGHNVFQPMGFDSFGLPAENYAIKTGIHPKDSTAANIEKMRKQLSAMGAMWNWDHEVVTSDPAYYKWTQWLFLKLFEAGLCERRKAPVNWCPSCQTVLANEQVENGFCERCKHEVIKKDLTQWFFRITDYAEQLLDYDEVEWPEKTIAMQQNWIGRSEGAEIDFPVLGTDNLKLRVYTTRPDTLFGVTYIVLAPEHELTETLTTEVYREDVADYVTESKKMTEIQRTSADREKTGVFTGSYATNPITKERIPVFIADFVLSHYGTGVVMATPAHDERDHAFALKYGLPIKQVVEPKDQTKIDVNKEAFTEYGIAVNSDFLNGSPTNEAKIKIIARIEEQDLGERKINYRLRDWLVSRQRYWGAPIPIVYDPSGKPHPIPEEHLPWLLPDDVEFKPTGTAPLAQSKQLSERTEKIFGKGWTPEVDTMDTFVCSSWYYFRYLCSTDSSQAMDKNLNKTWLPVDMYIGGAEHACMHLLYARFINRVMFDLGYTAHKEPFKRLVHQGLITKDGAKMSKSKGNVVSPDEFVEKYGSDVFRMYLMFLGPFTDGGDWSDKGISGIVRFQQRFYKMLTDVEVVAEDKEITHLLHKTIKKVSEDFWQMQYNTVIAAIMEFTNATLKLNRITETARKEIVKLIAPIAPHLAEELWRFFGNKETIFNASWPEFNATLAADNEIKIAVQVNGKLRGDFAVSPETTKETILEMAKKLENVASQLEEKVIVKEIYVPGKLVSLVVK